MCAAEAMFALFTGGLCHRCSPACVPYTAAALHLLPICAWVPSMGTTLAIQQAPDEPYISLLLRCHAQSIMSAHYSVKGFICTCHKQLTMRSAAPAHVCMLCTSSASYISRRLLRRDFCTPWGQSSSAHTLG